MSVDSFQNFLGSNSTVLDIPSEISSEKFGQLVIKCLIQRAKLEKCLWSQWVLFAAMELLFGRQPPALDIKTVAAIQQNCVTLRNCCNGHSFEYLKPEVETTSTGVQTHRDVTDASTMCSLRSPNTKTSKTKCTQTQVCVDSRGVNTHREEFIEGVVHVGCQTAKHKAVSSCSTCDKRKSEESNTLTHLTHIGCQTDPPWKLIPIKLANKTVQKTPKVVMLGGDSKLKVFYGRPLCESTGMQTPVISLLPIAPELFSVDPRI